MLTIPAVRGILRALAVSAWILCGCAADNEAGRSYDRVGRTIQPIIEGVPSGAEHDAVVVLAVFRDGARRGLCSATRVAPNLLLTARHCVSETDDQASCYTDGSAVAGAGLHGDFDPRELAVFVGEDGVASSVSDAALATAYGVKLIVDETAETICNRDLAFVLLDRPLTGRLAPMRVGAPRPDEALTVVGWGITESGSLPTTRMERADVPLVGTGPMVYPDDKRFGFGDAEFMTGESVCLGDSGGPAMTRSGVVVGIASRAGNGEARDPGNLAATCTGTTAHAIYTHLANAAPLVVRAFAEAGYVPLLEEPLLESALDPRHPRDPSNGSSALGKGLDPAGGRPTAETLRVTPLAGAATGEATDDGGGCAVARASACRSKATGRFTIAFALAVAAAARARQGRRRRDLR